MGLCAQSIAIAALAIGQPSLSYQIPVDSNSAQKADAVLALTKSTRIAYAVYNWNVITPPNGKSVETWGAEFNTGSHHRVETADNRIIADCEVQSGSWMNVRTGVIDTGESQAMAVCGIDTSKPIISKEWIGPVKTPFGNAVRVRFTDSELIRTYDVNDEGVILRTIYQINGDKQSVVLLDVAITPSLIYSFAEASPLGMQPHSPHLSAGKHALSTCWVRGGCAGRRRRSWPRAHLWAAIRRSALAVRKSCSLACTAPATPVVAAGLTGWPSCLHVTPAAGRERDCWACRGSAPARAR